MSKVEKTIDSDFCLQLSEHFLIPKLVKKGVRQSLNRSIPSMGAVAQNIFHQVDEDFTQVLGGEEYLHYSVSYLVPGLAAYFRELKLVDIVIRVHF